MSDSLVKHIALPKWSEPDSLDGARLNILSLGKSMHEHAYLVGKELIWVKKKVGHGEFLPWVWNNLWFGERTAQYMIGFANKCDKAKELLAWNADKYAPRADLPSPPLPPGKFRVIYADPPWSYDNSGFNQSAASQYPTLPTQAICDLPVKELASDSALFLWVTSPILPDGLAVMLAWGFEYKASMVWIKDRAPGIGWWANTKHEFLLIGACGDVGVPTIKHDSVVTADVSKHSQKPEEFRKIIESMFEPPYIELFARERAKGWESWGNQLTNAL